MCSYASYRYNSSLWYLYGTIFTVGTHITTSHIYRVFAYKLSFKSASFQITITNVEIMSEPGTRPKDGLPYHRSWVWDHTDAAHMFLHAFFICYFQQGHNFVNVACTRPWLQLRIHVNLKVLFSGHYFLIPLTLETYVVPPVDTSPHLCHAATCQKGKGY